MGLAKPVISSLTALGALLKTYRTIQPSPNAWGRAVMGQEQPQGGAAGRGATQVTLEHFSAWELHAEIRGMKGGVEQD